MTAIAYHDVGGWIFQRRTWLPLVAIPVLLLMPFTWIHNLRLEVAVGLPLLAAGEMIRLISVGYAGRITRTRSGAVGPLVVAGPYRLVRNPLYIGNALIAAGALCLAGRFVVLPVALAVLACYYQAVVKWEEKLLSGVFGEEYVDYCQRVPRWVPRLRPCPRLSLHRFSAAEAVQSERGTLCTLAGVLLVAALLQGLYASGAAPLICGR